MGYHYELYKRTMEEAARRQDLAAANGAAGGIRVRGTEGIRRIQERTEAARRRQGAVGDAIGALPRVEVGRQELAALEREIPSVKAELEALEQIIASYEKDAEPLLARAEDLARLRREAQAEANRRLSQTKALDAEAASHREGREGAESTLPFERQAREELEGRLGPAEREAAQALARIQAAHAEVAQKRAAALAEAAAEAARVDREALAAVEARAKERAAQALEALQRAAQAERGAALSDAAAEAERLRDAAMQEAVDKVEAEAKKEMEKLASVLTQRKAEAARPTAAEELLPSGFVAREGGSVPTPEQTQSSLRRAIGTVEPVLAIVPIEAVKDVARKLPAKPEAGL